MFYVKNVPAWERIVRLVAALASAACAARFWGQPVGYVFAVAAATAALTAGVGFCPMCWLAGRRLVNR